MQLFVRGGNAASRSVVLDVQQGELVADVLRKYEAKEGFPAEALRVIFQGNYPSVSLDDVAMRRYSPSRTRTRD